mmetsp:Transcript_36194/g.99774  ORF Transcript_36194/g.99774 Transcript_36194/m.99774 type:complete len:342 (-) Transcript_36194:130-1155(-)
MHGPKDYYVHDCLQATLLARRIEISVRSATTKNIAECSHHESMVRGAARYSASGYIFSTKSITLRSSLAAASSTHRSHNLRGTAAGRHRRKPPRRVTIPGGGSVRNETRTSHVSSTPYAAAGRAHSRANATLSVGCAPSSKRTAGVQMWSQRSNESNACAATHASLSLALLFTSIACSCTTSGDKSTDNLSTSCGKLSIALLGAPSPSQPSLPGAGLASIESSVSDNAVDTARGLPGPHFRAMATCCSSHATRCFARRNLSRATECASSRVEHAARYRRTANHVHTPSGPSSALCVPGRPPCNAQGRPACIGNGENRCQTISCAACCAAVAMLTSFTARSM